MSLRLLPRAAFAVFVLLLAVPGGWAAGSSPVPSPKTGLSSAEEPLTEAECVAFGEEIARAINEGRSEEVLAAFDPYALADRVLRGIELEEGMRQGFLSTFIGGVKRTLASGFSKCETARFLRVQTVNGELRPLVRVLTDEGGLNFHAFVTARRANGRAKWIDAHVYLSGELLSESMRRLVLPAFAEQNAGLLARLTRGEGDYVKSMPLIKKAQEKLGAGELAEAKAIFDQLPEAVRRTKGVLGVRLQVAQKIGDAEYLAVLDEWARAFPGDPSLELIGLDADFLRKNYAGVVRRLDALERLLGGDPYLEYLRATTLLMAGKIEESRHAARKALAEDPAMSSAYDVLLQIELDAKNHKGTVGLLDEIEAAYPGADMAVGIAEEAAYGTFRASEEHAQWLVTRAARKTAAE